MQFSRSILAVFAAGILASPAVAGAAPAQQQIAIVGADILPMTGVDRLRDQTVIIAGDRIVAVGPRGKVQVPTSARVVDAVGKVLTPGLVDMHVHLAPFPGDPGDAAQRALAVMLAHGVTTFRGMAGSSPNLVVRQRIEAGELPGPRFYAASPALNDSNTKSPAEGIAAVDKAKADGFDLIKSHELSDVAIWQAIEDEAHKVGLPTAGHVNKNVGLPRALAEGQEVEHLDGAIAELLPPNSPELAQDFGQVPPPEILAVAAKASDADLAALARRVAAAKSWQVPTLGLFEELTDIETPTEKLLAGPDMRYVPDPVLQQWAAQREELRQEAFTPQSAAMLRELRRRIVHAYHDAGVPLMTGSDTAQAFHLWGPAEYQEIKALTRAGLTPMEALRSATVVPRDYFRSLVNGGSALGWKAEFGTIEVGARADIDVWSADPSTDLAALDNRPQTVIAGGRLYDRATLDAMLGKAAADAKAAGQAPAVAPPAASKSAFVIRDLPALAAGSNPGLTAAGTAAARALANQLAQAGITAVFATPSRRAQETAAPLGARLGIAVTAYDQARPDSLAKAVAAVPGSVLVVAEGDTVPELIGRLGGVPLATIADKDFGILYRVDPASHQVRAFKAGGAAMLDRCTTKGMPGDALCGHVRVAENRAAPARRTIEIHFAVLPATGPVRDDPLVVLPGGPGLGGVQDGAGIATLFAEIRKGRDILLIDQRGTGASNPLTCPQAPSETNPVGELGGFRASEVVECRRKLERKADLRYYFTREAVLDMEKVRSVLGYSRLDLFGMSYGTRVALDYLRLFPDRVGQTVIRAAAPTDMKLPLWSSRDTQTSFNRVAEECLAQPDCAAKHPDLKGDLAAIVGALDRAPAPIRVKDPTTGKTLEGGLTRDGFGQVMFSLLYIPQTYVMLPPLLAKARAGDLSPITQAAAPFVFGVGGEIAWGMYWSVICDEDVRRIDPKSIDRATAGTFLGRAPIDHELRACANWPRSPVPASYLRPVRSDKPVFIISGYNDPVAGKVWGDVIARTLPNSLHVEAPGAAHLPPLPGCTGALMEEFLDGAPLKELDTACVAKATPPRFMI